MARATRINRSELTKLEIMRHATRCFLEDGYSNTSVKAISKALNMSPGNLTFHYPTKEHMLAEVVAQLCEFQEKILEYEAQKGYDPATVIGFELMTVAVACADSEIARDFFISTFQSELCRSYLFRSHVARAKKIFARECPNWTDQQFQEAEVLHVLDLLDARMFEMTNELNKVAPGTFTDRIWSLERKLYRREETEQ